MKKVKQSKCMMVSDPHVTDSNKKQLTKKERKMKGKSRDSNDDWTLFVRSFVGFSLSFCFSKTNLNRLAPTRVRHLVLCRVLPNRRLYDANASVNHNGQVPIEGERRSLCSCVS